MSSHLISFSQNLLPVAIIIYDHGDHDGGDGIMIMITDYLDDFGDAIGDDDDLVPLEAAERFVTTLRRLESPRAWFFNVWFARAWFFLPKSSSSKRLIWPCLFSTKVCMVIVNNIDNSEIVLKWLEQLLCDKVFGPLESRVWMQIKIVKLYFMEPPINITT